MKRVYNIIATVGTRPAMYIGFAVADTLAAARRAANGILYKMPQQPNNIQFTAIGKLPDDVPDTCVIQTVGVDYEAI